MTERSDGNELRGGTERTGFDGGTGRYGQVLTTGQDGRGRCCRRDGTVQRQVLSTGRDGKGTCPPRDGTVNYNARDFLDGTGRYELTVGEIVDGQGRGGTTVPFLMTVLPSRPVPSRRYRQYRPVNKP